MSPDPGQAGFTIVESLVAALVVAVGILTSYMMLVVALHSSADVRARETAVALARQIVEDARSVAYSQLSNATITTTLQGFPGLGNASSSGGPWTIARNGVTYTVSASVATLSDPKDTTGATDIKQVTTTVSWTTFQKTRTVSETVTVTAAGQDPGPSASALQLAAWPVTGISGTQNAPVVTSSSVSALQFSVNASTGTTAIVWTLNGARQSSWQGPAPGSGTKWTSAQWQLSGVSDGTYTIGAQAEDSSGVDGPGVTITVRLIRNVPSAPAVSGDGFNSNFMVGGNATTVAELQWDVNPELNVVGYDVYNPSGTLICQAMHATKFPAGCGASAWCSSLTACVDMNPPAVTASNPTYTVKALYYDATNTLQEGAAANVTLTSGTPAPPSSPPSLTVTPQPDGTADLTWGTPSGGTPVSFYRIYRDSSAYTSRYDTLSAARCSTTCTYHDSERSSSHTYYVTAVGGTSLGSDMAESAPTGPVSG